MASFFIRAHKGGWRLIEQSYENGTSIQKTVKVEHFITLGFDRSWPLDQAKRRVKEINTLNHIIKSQESIKLRIAEKVKKKQESNNMWTPYEQVKEFEKRLEANNMGTKNHLGKTLVMWDAAQKIVEELNIDPRFYSDYSQAFYNLFIKKQYSMDYSKKLLSLINRWGLFYCKSRGVFFEAIPMPIAQQKKRIERAYKESPRCRSGGSTSLNEGILIQLEKHLPKDQYDFMFISLWLGLRPIEIEYPEFSIYQDNDLKVLRIWQSKIEEFKHIPLIFPQQIKAAELLRPIKRPLNRVIQRVTKDPRLTVYGGRKGFENLMTGLGRGLAEISAWLGHTSIRTTKTHYETKDKLIMIKVK